MFYWHTHPYVSRQQVVAFLELSKEQGHYDVFVTIDQGFELEHNLKKLSFGFLIIHVPKNTLEFYEAIEGGQAVHVYSEESDYVSPPSTASPGLLGESRQLPTTPAAAPSPDPPPSLAAPAASTPPALPTPSGIMPART